jgi:hypothetical protein
MEGLQFYQARSQSDLAMDSEQLRELIKQEEGAKLDFKIKLYEIYSSEKEQHWDEFIKDILSLTNGNIGTAKEIGYLVIGVGDKLKPDGTRDLLNVDDVKLNRKQLLDKVSSACHPPLPDIRCETVLLDGKNLFVVSIPPSPYLHELSRYLKTPKKGYSPYTVLIRRKDGEKVYEASEEEKQKLRKEKETIPVSCVDGSKATTSIESLVQEVRSRCCDKVQHLHSKIQLLNRQQIDVDQLYVDLYVLEKLASEAYATIPDLLKGADLRDGFERLGLGNREKRSPGFEVATHYPRLMVLGKPGSGKSTFLRHLAVACCKGEFLADHIPILIELRAINAGEFNLLNYIHQEFDLANEEQTKQILKQGKVLILLDGLDEVPGQSRREVQDHIYEFSQFQQYYKNRFILTCRTQTIKYISDKFEPVEVADFNPEQVEIFAQNWFTALAETPEQGAELTVKFLGKLRLPENKQTAELAVTPILLSLTCWVFNGLKDLPLKRSDLYEQGINLLLETWDEKRGVRREVGSEIYQKLSIGEKKKLLSYVAARKLEQEQYVLFEQGEIQEYIAGYLGISTEDSEAVLEAVEAQHGLLIKRAHGFWSFSHLTFQEYFAAKWFCTADDFQGLSKNLINYRWREVFLLAANLPPTIDNLLIAMKKVIDKLILENEILEQILVHINQKAITELVYCRQVKIRGFYLDLIYNYNVESSLIIDANFLSHLNLYMVLNKKDNNIIPHSCILDHSLCWMLAYIRISPPPPLVEKYQFELNKALKNAVNSCKILVFNDLISIEFYERLLEIWQKYLNLNKDCKDVFLESWKAEGETWTEQLITMIKCRNLGKNWQFSEQHKEIVKQYYYSNKLLIDCLDSGCAVSNEVRQKIEETLLLPMAEINKCQQPT